jgi:methylated-DNA-[protein]-cysteine S-methyltransferase
MTAAYIDTISSPVGAIDLAVDESGALIELWFREGRHPMALEQRLSRAGLQARRGELRTAEVRRQLREYFEGTRQAFDLPLAAKGSPTQQAVWRELTFIPYGETVSYGELADAIGMPGEAQMVGAACAANPIPLVVPCHRVVAADGSLRGYSAGLHIKEQLLSLERGQRFLLAWKSA